MRRHLLCIAALALAACAPPAPVIETTATSNAGESGTAISPSMGHCSTDRGLQSSVADVINGVRYGATLSWTAGEREACLALTRVDGDVKTLVLGSPIPAGWSERYDESSAPTLDGDLLQVSDGLPWVITDRLAQGEGGGGGDVATLWRASDDAWTEVLTFSLETYSDINTLTETPCSTGEAFFRFQDGELEVHPCFDGEPQPVQRWRIVAGRAEPLP